MQLGPIQKQWVENLRKHPERKGHCVLGSRKPSSGAYKACCLGEAILTYHRVKKKKFPFRASSNSPEEALMDPLSGSLHYLSVFHQRLGLKGERGEFLKSDGEPTKVSLNLGFNDVRRFISLAAMNDNPRVSWTQIADVIEQNADLLFYKSV